MGPVRAVTAPVTTDPTRYPETISFPAGTPRAAAHSSPTASTFQLLACANVYNEAPRTSTAMLPSVVKLVDSIPPINQRVIAMDCPKVAALWRNRIPAIQMLLIV